MTEAKEECVILYHDSCTWEVDYIKERLCAFPSMRGKSCLFFEHVTTAQLIGWTKPCDILVFSSNTLHLAQVKNIVANVQPKVILHLSEEEGTKPEFVELSDMCNAVLRQHWFPKQYPHRHNIYQIPLGFMTGFLQHPLPVVPIDKRYYTWSFIGALNQPRVQMIHVIRSHWPTKKHFLAEKGIEVNIMAHFYSQSVFVPNERGCVRLDCFRIYEAIEAGAIPVVVGDKKELQETFCFDGDAPPFVSAQTWPDALVACDTLLSDPDNLLRTQLSIRAWYGRQITRAQERIGRALDAPLVL